ncbi:energy-coupling factor transporter ATPase [Thermoactinomyces vulgaris]|uniref:energy-coupling factor transporter ATPase n=1 Tax=Thermoactinomyces vulgaris TaxID=2026 RepID=UPI000673462D|nr:energy-coupling factor transporter ATPase [Thermoactinomyces vulgaris]QBK12799.1 energy-coupling factor transporter ATPase [Thermoactinomyces vulgaris]
MEIVIQDLSVKYLPNTPFEREALSRVCLRIPKGSFAAVVGGTGSGKSTLIQCIAGLIRPSAGHVQVGDLVWDARSQSGSALRRHVGLVFQYPEHQLFAETVAADIAFGLKNRGVEEPERSRRVRWAMDLVGLAPELCDRSPFHLSGGQMRRVAIAGVLALEPDILILDEPSAGLDPEGEEELFALLKKLHQQGKTIVLVTHDMNHVVRCADRVFVLADGKLVLSGTPEEVFSREQKWQELSLALPYVTQLILKMNRKLNPPLPLSIFTLDALEKALEKRFASGVNAK